MSGQSNKQQNKKATPGGAPSGAEDEPLSEERLLAEQAIRRRQIEIERLKRPRRQSAADATDQAKIITKAQTLRRKFSVTVRQRKEEIEALQISFGWSQSVTTSSEQATKMEALANEFISYLTNDKEEFYGFITAPSRVKKAEKLIEHIAAAAVLFADYARKVKQYNPSEARIALSWVISQLASLDPREPILPPPRP